MLNKVTLIGNLGKDPEQRTFANSGNTVTSFPLATTENWKNQQGEKQSKTTWHNIQIFGKLGDVAAQYLKKGSKVYLEGKIDNRSYEKDGVTHYVTDINVHEMKMLGDAQQSDNSSYGQQQQQSKQNNTFANTPPGQNDEPDDLPF